MEAPGKQLASLHYPGLKLAQMDLGNSMGFKLSLSCFMW